MKIAICDDDKDIRYTINSYISEYFQTKNCQCPEIALFATGDEYLKSVENNQTYDIVFLDISMPGTSGINICSRMTASDGHTLYIMVTSHTDYIDESLHFNAFRFMIKPIKKDSLFLNLEDAVKKITTINEKLDIITKEQVISVYSSDIMLLIVIGRKLTIYTTSDTYNSSKPLSYYDDMLNHDVFFETTKGCMINLAYVKSIEKKHVILMHNNAKYKVHLTNRKYNDIVKAHLMFLNIIT